MASQQNINLVRRLYDELYNQNNQSVCDELISNNIKLNDPAQPSFRGGLSSFKQLQTTYRQAFPDMKVKIDDIVSDENKISVRWTTTGTHKGDLDDISPTNKPFKVSGISIYTITNGKITEINQIWDRLALLEQLGEIQPAAHALH